MRGKGRKVRREERKNKDMLMTERETWEKENK